MCSLLSGRQGPRWQAWMCSILILMIASLAIGYMMMLFQLPNPTVGHHVFGNHIQHDNSNRHNGGGGGGGGVRSDDNQQQQQNQLEFEIKGLPSILLEEKIYSETDFRNNQGIVPSFWNENKTCGTFNQGGKDCTEVWGPCYPPTEQDVDDWNKAIQDFSVGPTNDDSKLQYLNQKSANIIGAHQHQHGAQHHLANFCRPGFLIIGQGKCGTSSLYHYLIGHPRVLPANQKQIHYFKYYARQGLKWYLGHFPSTVSMMANGALMTGEASPGYLPYPDVVALTKHEMTGTKIICVGRDPLDRAYSSYRYNYVNPAIEAMQRGKGTTASMLGIAKRQARDYYLPYLYTFEEMMRAELTTLQRCLNTTTTATMSTTGGGGDAGGIGIGIGIGSEGAKQKWGSKTWAQPEYERREAANLPPLVDLDGQCYGDFISKEVPRQQWQALVTEQPGKFLNVPAVHLSQAMIGRSLYVYPLEWWYALFQQKDDNADMLYFLCTEEMKDMSGEGIAKVSRFLGLPEYNFSSVVSQGMFNVGGHKGYDKVTSWDTFEEEEETHEEEETTAKENAKQPLAVAEEEEAGIPLSDEFRKELLDFLKPHNERLFELVGRRCNWSS